MTEGSLRQKLASFLFSYHRTPQSTTGVAPSELLMGRKLRSVLDLLPLSLKDKVDTVMATQKASHDKCSKERSFKVGDNVRICLQLWSRTKLDQWYNCQLFRT